MAEPQGAAPPQSPSPTQSQPTPATPPPPPPPQQQQQQQQREEMMACVAALEAALLPCLPARELQAVDRSAHSSHQSLQVESKPTNVPEDALSSYGDEVDYEPTPSPPEVFEDDNTDVPLDENVDICLDSGAGDSQSEIPIVAKSFLADRIMNIVKTFNRRNFRSAREEVSKYSQCLSALGIDTSELERRIKPIFDHAEAIEELESSPDFISTVRLMNADENLVLRKGKLASHISTKSSPFQATESVSLQLQQTREKIKKLEESISHLKSTEAELSLKLEVIDDSLKKLQPSQEELQKDVADAEKEHAAATEGYNDSKESTGLRALIELFEERRQIFEI